MDTWLVGSARITKVAEIDAPVPSGGPGSMIPEAVPDAVQQIGWLVPDFATEEGFLRLSVHSLLIDTGSARVVVDTCIGNGRERTNPFFHELESSFLQDFESVAGWTRESVDAVVITHLHVDHVGWNTVWDGRAWSPTFPNAMYCVGRSEWEHWSESPHGTDADRFAVDSLHPITEAGLLRFVEDGEAIVPGVVPSITPGHTPGHLSVLIDSEDERAVITGDVMHHPCQMARPDWACGFDTDANRGTESRWAFLDRYADSNVLVIGTHFGGRSAGWIKRDGVAFRFDPVDRT